MKLINENLIKKWEVKEVDKPNLEAYLPTPDDVWTIGWGHTEGVKKGMTITHNEAQRLFEKDVQWVEDAINQLVKVGLHQKQFDATCAFVFNIGRTNFAASTFLRKLNAGDYEGAAAELPRWNKQKGKVLRGLVRRRAGEMEYFLSDTISIDTPTGVDEVPPLKPMWSSKEVIAGVGASLTGVSTLLGSVSTEAQNTLSTGLVVALVLFGGFILWNRVKSRQKGER